MRHNYSMQPLKPLHLFCLYLQIAQGNNSKLPHGASTGVFELVITLISEK